MDKIMDHQHMDPKTGRRLLERQFFSLLPLQILLLAIPAVNGLVSGFFGSNYVSVEAMSAIGLFMPVGMFVTASGAMLVSGSQILCSRLIGEDQLAGTRRIFLADLVIAAVISVTISALLLVCVFTGMTGIFTDSARVEAALKGYMIGQAAGIPPLIMGQQLSAFLSLEDRQVRPRVASILYILANLFLCDMLVRRFHAGVLGLSLASGLGAWVFFFVLVPYYVSGKSGILGSDRGSWHVYAQDILSVIRTGFPGALHYGFEMLRTITVNTLIVKYVTSVGLSSLAAVDSVMRIFWAVPFGMLAVSRMLIGISIGEEDRRELTDIMRNAVFRCIPLMCVISAGLILCAGPLSGIFYKDPLSDVYQMTRMGFRILPLCLPFTIFSQHFVFYAQASRQHFLEYVNPFMAGFAFVSLFSFLLMPLIGMKGVYVANVLNSALCCAVVLLYSWVKRRRFPKNMEELMVLPDDFGVSGDERLDITVNSMNEVVEVSGKAIDFCRARGIDMRRTFFTGLFLEEMAGNVVTHGFRGTKRSHFVDIRVVNKKDDIFLRIKDDCSPFNPKEFNDLLVPEDPAAGIGIRIVFRLAKEVRYQNILGLNVLTVYLPERGEEELKA